MFIKQTNLIQRGKIAALIPESLTTLNDYVDAGPLSNKPYHYGIACYWRGVEEGKNITAFGYFSVITFLPPDLYLYGVPNRSKDFWKNDSLISYEDFLQLGFIATKSLEGFEPASYEMSHKLGKKYPYSNPHYAKKFFPELESYYDPELHQVLHANPEALPAHIDGWYKWSNKKISI